MNIGMLLNAAYPSDMRVKKEANALLKAGHKVFLLCAKQPKEKSQQDFEGIQIERIPVGNGNIQLAFWDIVISLTFVHPIFLKKGLKWAQENKIDALHVHDLPLAGTAFKIRKELGIPVVVDFHENYPDALRTWFEWKTNPVTKLKNKIFMNPSRWSNWEKVASEQADRVIAVVKEMHDRLIHDYSISPSKITIVSNTEEKSFLDQTPDQSVYGNYQNKFIITYSGNIGPHRGVDTVIEAMKHLKNQPEILFLIIGSGSPAVMNMLTRLIHESGVKNQVHLMGRQPFSKFYSFMRYASVNIIPHKSNRHTDNTIPHKLFQAMMVGQPVLVSSSDPIKRVIEETGGGLVFKAGDASDLAEKILKLYRSPELCASLGRNGLNATINGTYNWETEQVHLVKLYENLVVK